MRVKIIVKITEILAEIKKHRLSYNNDMLFGALSSMSIREKVDLLTILTAEVFVLNLKENIKRHILNIISNARAQLFKIYDNLSTPYYSAATSVQSKYDVLFNPFEKVIFETALAGAIINQLDKMQQSIHKVASAIADILEKTLFHDDLLLQIKNGKIIQDNYFEYLNKLDCYELYNHHINRDTKTLIQRSELPTVKKWVLSSLRDANDKNIIKKLLLIHLYTGFITRPDRMGVKDISDVPSELFVSQDNKDTLILTLNKYEKSSQPGLFNAKGRSISRKARKVNGVVLEPTPEMNPPQNITGIIPGKGVPGSASVNTGIFSKQLLSLLQTADTHSPSTCAGIFQPCFVSEPEIKRDLTHFYDEAVFKLNMPLVAGASGGAGTHEVAIVLTNNLTETEIKHIRAAVLAMYISRGFHSLHEVCSIQKLCGSDYKPGQYSSVMQMYADILSTDDYKTLTDEFSHLLKNDCNHVISHPKEFAYTLFFKGAQQKTEKVVSNAVKPALTGCVAK